MISQRAGVRKWFEQLAGFSCVKMLAISDIMYIGFCMQCSYTDTKCYGDKVDWGHVIFLPI